jgi:hypothetical protein
VTVFHANISAVQFEIGKYNECIATIVKALSMFKDPSDNVSIFVLLF